MSEQQTYYDDARGCLADAVHSLRMGNKGVTQRDRESSVRLLELEGKLRSLETEYADDFETAIGE